MSGAFTENEEEIEAVILDFFSKLYTKERHEEWEVEGIEWGIISQQEALNLEIPFSEDEVWCAINGYGGDKAPGAHGFTMEFYKEFWGLIKKDIMNVMEDFQRNGVVSAITNETYIYI
ncbi:hypothetical protein Scep_026412 [Stephania cephalantha]|uniref:Uncharacterized protein n=1 Tax=Stephania cephalantha TaxID=152367 RepID=A0AAP0ESC8_9MAGN